MKKVNKLLMMGFGLLLLVLTTNVNAAEISYGTAETNAGETKIPLIITLEDEETFSENITVTCETDNDNVSCSFEANTGTAIQATGKTAIIATVSEDGYSEGETIGYLILTNSTEQKRSDVLATVTSSINTIFKKFDVKAKEVEKVASTDATLSELEVSPGTMSPTFSKDVYNYTVYNISDTINKIKIKATCNDGGYCTPNVSGGNKAEGYYVYLNQGENKVTIEVEAEAGNKLTYYLTVYRGETSYNSAKLSSIDIGDYTLTPAFSKDTYEYSTTVPNAVTSLSTILKATAEDTNATVNITGLDNFVIGENTITITIDNVNGDESVTYLIKVKRMSDDEIEVIKYKNSEITFKDSEGVQSTLSESDFKTQYPEEWEKIKDGTYKFDDDGNIVTETETKEEETEEETKESSNLWLIIILIVVGLLIIIISGIFIFKPKKAKKDKDNKDDSKKDSIDEKEVEKELAMEGIEENKKTEDIEDEKSIEDKTMDIDEALSDLMSTKQYEFKDED